MYSNIVCVYKQASNPPKLNSTLTLARARVVRVE